MINNTTEKVFEDALKNSLVSVKTALDDSFVDGDKSKHKGILTKMEKKSEEVWGGNIINEIE